jgi:hypothetical protein
VKKFKLDIDRLCVDSFRTATADAASGTVVGQEATIPQNTCQRTCFNGACTVPLTTILTSPLDGCIVSYNYC